MQFFHGEVGYFSELHRILFRLLLRVWRTFRSLPNVARTGKGDA